MAPTWRNKTTFQTASLVGAAPGGGLRLSIIVKGTFTIVAGQPATPAGAPFPIWTVDQFPDDDPARTVRFESDLIPVKPRCDVLLVGAARSPDGKPVTEMVVGLRVGTMAWAFQVIGDRTWSFPSRLTLTPVMTPPRPFVEMPLVYERAYGGIDLKGGGVFDQNPAGKGYLSRGDPDVVDGRPLPNLVGLRDEIRNWNSRLRPVGFGFYGRHWMPRMATLGVDPANGAPKGPFRVDHYNAAHPELQVDGFLRGDESVEMRNLTPSGTLRFRLPGVRPAVRVKRRLPAGGGDAGQTGAGSPPAGSGRDLVTMNLDTVCFLPDEGRLYLVWRGLVPVSDLDASVVESIAVMSARLDAPKSPSIDDFSTTTLVTRRRPIGETTQVIPALDFADTCRIGPPPAPAAGAAGPVVEAPVGGAPPAPATPAPSAPPAAPPRKTPRAPGVAPPIVLLPQDVDSSGISAGGGEPPALMPGFVVFDGFRLIREIHRGEKGVIWLALDEKMRKEVALRILPETLSRDDRAVEDLKKEVRNSLGLTHSNILRMFGFHEGEGRAGISMEYVDGRTLAEIMAGRPGRNLEPSEIRPWLDQICDALIYAHGKARLAHRDLRPSNVMVNERGLVKLKGFGISRRITDTRTRISKKPPGAETLAYRSPQQILGGRPHVTDDVYGWGAMVFDLLTGTPPYTGDPIAGISKGEPPAVSQRRRELGVGREPVPAAWEMLIGRCLSHKPEARPGGMAQVLEMLSRESVEAPGPEPGAGEKEPGVPPAGVLEPEPPAPSTRVLEPGAPPTRVLAPEPHAAPTRVLAPEPHAAPTRVLAGPEEAAGAPAVERGQSAASGKSRSPWPLILVVLVLVLAGITLLLMKRP